MRQGWQNLDWGWKAAWLGIFWVALFKIWLIIQVPICTFHNDSHTYLRTAKMFWADWHISIHPKRSFLYPVLLTLLASLPVRLSLTIICLQQAITLFIPLIAVRLLKEWTSFWRWLALPLVLFLGLNVTLLFYGHDMIAEAFYVTAFWFFLWKLWRFIFEPSTKHYEGLLWVAFLCLSLRPDGKVTVLIAGSALFLFGWSWLKTVSCRSKSFLRILLPAIACVGLWIGTSKHVTQQGWLFYSSVFPLTDLDSKLQQDYKKELRPLVEFWRANLKDYPENQGVIQWQLVNPKGKSIGPLWDKLRSKGQNSKLHEVCRQLAVEAVLHHPMGFMKLLVYKLYFVLNTPREYARKFLPEKIGDEWIDEMKAEPDYVPLLLGSHQTLEQWMNGFFAQRGVTPANRALSILEPITAPIWWSWAGLISMIGWWVAILRWRVKLLFWFGVLIGYLLLTYTIARGIPRYLLPFEPLMALGWALLVAQLQESYQRHKKMA
ncbi:MAG: hypothetical protein K1X66_02935 [Verrucomicrobiae bacterium]|nr:hypothetical protein [Verrucomicrobiae bacterium]